MAFEVNFVHYRTWLYGKAVPACDPTERTKARLRPTSTVMSKVTCAKCLARIESGQAITLPVIGSINKGR